MVAHIDSNYFQVTSSKQCLFYSSFTISTQKLSSEFNFNFNLIYYLAKENTNGHFPSIALASRGRKQQKREGCHNSLSNCFIDQIKSGSKNLQVTDFKVFCLLSSWQYLFAKNNINLDKLHTKTISWCKFHIDQH